jgi:acetyl-CoA carboxylase biotin carboxylase subunit
MVTGVDIVRAQLRIAGGDPLDIAQHDVTVRGHAIECRINAESVERDFLPSPGTITRWDPPAGAGIRVDSHCFTGYTVPPYYDSLLAKLVVTGTDRSDAIDRMLRALDELVIEGVDTTAALHRAVLAHPDFRGDAITTRWLETTFLPSAKEIAHG